MNGLITRPRSLLLVAVLAVVACVVVLTAPALPANADDSTPTVSPTHGPPGTKVTASAADWTGCSSMSVSGWGTTLGTAAISSTGAFSLPFTVPSNAPAGPAQLMFSPTCTHSTVAPFVTFTVDPPGTGMSAPAAPSNLTATAVDQHDIRLNWQDNSSNETGFEINNGVVSREAGAGSTTYTWGGLAPGTYMCFKVRAYNSAGDSAWDPNVSPYYVCTTTPKPAGASPPAAPSNLTAVAVSPTSVRLKWTNNAANQSGVVISRNGVVSVDVQGATVSRYTWTGLSPGTKYWFYVASKIYGTPGDPTGYGNTQSAWVGPVYVTTPNPSSGSGWAGSSFCASFPYSQALSGTPFDGMAACGSNKWYGGTVRYQNVVFESAYASDLTWQCTELAARWFYIDTGLVAPLADNGKNVAEDYYQAHKQFTVSNATSAFDPSIHAGDIISMWGGPGSDPAGHVAIVTHVGVTGGKDGTGTISLIEENGASSGNFYITVNNGQMYYYGSPKNGKYYYTTFQWINLPSK